MVEKGELNLEKEWKFRKENEWLTSSLSKFSNGERFSTWY